ncbi:unnamed protein product [Adineta ricciae]|uniref:Uncharacterized protein n=1 Tax=Adineta ricciae TaxID=249248 RepID=A0A815BNV1_ADIRI|nr:unnamed protein product [Adineta ricciae]CAF1343168.1 unnamed protein product [Adineta ricciae]
MGNLSPRHSKSYHEGFSNHLTLTPNRSSWKKQLQIINDTFNIKKISLRRTHGKGKRSSATTADNIHFRQHSYSTQNFHDFTKKNPAKSASRKQSKTDQQQNNVKKSFSLFSIKQPLNDLTNKEPVIKSVSTNKPEEVSMNSTTNTQIQPRQKSRVDLTTVHKRHTTFIPPAYYLSKSQSQYYQRYHIQLSSNGVISNNTNPTATTSSAKHVRSTEITTTRKTIIQASTSELLRCLSEYLCSSCSHLSPKLDPMDCIAWIKSADRRLILQGWQEQVFVNPANIVFVYLIVRDTLTYVVPSTTIKSVSELHSIVLTCLYLAFSYMGHEITYPLKPFVTENETRTVFWQRMVLIMGQLSSKMLTINQNPKFFTECFSDLKKFNLVQ